MWHGSDRTAVASTLYRTHPPTFAETGLISYDRARGRVAASDRLEAAQSLLSSVSHWAPGGVEADVGATSDAGSGAPLGVGVRRDEVHPPRNW